jgi:AraC-like DNA-binding protein
MDKLFKHTIHHSPSPIAKKNGMCMTSISHYKHEADEVAFYRNFAKGFQMFYTVSGEGWVDYDSNYQVIVPGTITCVNLEYRHGFGAAKNHIWEHYWMIFDGENFNSIYEMIFKSCNVHNAFNPQHLHQLFKDLFLLKKNNYLYLDVAAMSCILQVASDLLFFQSIDCQSNRTLHLKSVETVAAFIENNFHTDITVEKLAKTAGYSVFHFSRIFKEHTGFSPADYLIKTRIDKAKELLSRTSLPIELIAEKAGFHSPNYFNKVFKEREHQTPGQYRKITIF